MGESGTIKVLVLMPTNRTVFAISNLPQDVYCKYKFLLHCPKPKPGHSSNALSLQDYLEDARDAIVREKIDIVFAYSNDLAALLKAALVQEFPHLRGPSLESVFLGYNKYYTRCFLDPQPIPFASVDLSVADLHQACQEALYNVGVPAFFKPSCLSTGKGIACITTIQELQETSQAYAYSATSDHRFVESFLFKNIDESKYPLASRPTAIVEKHMGGATIVNADGYVFEGKIFHWSISDNLYSQVKPNYTFGTAHPTTLPASMQQEVWKAFDAVVEKMVVFGYDNEFVNIEWFVQSSGEIRLMEINPRRGGNMLISGLVFRNGDVTAAQLMIAQGIQPKSRERNSCHVLYGYIKTCGVGQAKELYDYSCTDPGLIPEVEPDHVINGSEEAGGIVARAIVSGASREEVMDKYRSMCKRVLLKPKLSIWE